jgi:hypothetical protein
MAGRHPQPAWRQALLSELEGAIAAAPALGATVRLTRFRVQLIALAHLAAHTPR